jgi:hypothetical protein
MNNQLTVVRPGTAQVGVHSAGAGDGQLGGMDHPAEVS